MFNDIFHDWHDTDFDQAFCLALAKPLVAFVRRRADAQSGIYYHGHISDFESASSCLFRMGAIFGRDQYAADASIGDDAELDINWSETTPHRRVANYYRVPDDAELKDLEQRNQLSAIGTSEMLAAYVNIFSNGYDIEDLYLRDIDEEIRPPENHIAAFDALVRKGFAEKSENSSSYMWTRKFKSLVDEINSGSA